MNDIPIDVLYSILDLTHPADLPALCRVNKELQCHASAILYKNLNPAQANIIDICGTLCRSPHLALRVKHFTATLDAIRCLRRDDLVLVAQTLRCLINLQSLKLFVHGANAWMLEHCTFKLRSFNSTLDPDSTFLSFLSTQPELTSVKFWVDIQNHQLPPSSLPNLTHIHAQFSWVSQLIPGRPIQEVLVWERRDGWPHHIPVDNISFMSSSTSQIRKLTIGSPSLRAIPTQEVYRILPDLETLIIVLPGKITSFVDEETQSLGRWLKNLLSDLPHLHSFTLMTSLPSFTSEPHFSWSDADELLFLENAVALAPTVTSFNMYSLRWPWVRTDWRRVNDGWKIEQRDTPESEIPKWLRLRPASPAEPTKPIRPVSTSYSGSDDNIALIGKARQIASVYGEWEGLASSNHLARKSQALKI